MPAVQVRDLPQESYNLLKERAKANGRSINKELETLVIENVCASAEAAVHSPASLEDITAKPLQNPFYSDDDSERALRRRVRSSLFARIDQEEPFPVHEGWNAASVVRSIRQER